MENKKAGVDDALIKVITPSATFYCASAYSASGIARLFERTGKSLREPPLICVDSRIDILNLASEFPETAYVLSTRLWPGPLNIILLSSGKTPDILNDASSYLLLNMPSGEEFREIIRNVGTPLAICALDEKKGIISSAAEEQVYRIESEIIIDGTTVSFTDPEHPVMVCEDSISKSIVEEITGSVGESSLWIGDFWSRLPRTLIPSTPFFVTCKDSLTINGNGLGRKIGLVTFGSGAETRPGYATVKNLSSIGDVCEAAANLYSTIKEMDSAGLDAIFLETLPETGLGVQVNVRMKEIGLDIKNLGFLMNEAY